MVSLVISLLTEQFTAPLRTAPLIDLFHLDTPKHAVVLAHGLFGFGELRLAGPYLPGLQYWRGIKEALSMKGVQVITATVPPSASIEIRAEELARDIAIEAKGKAVNIIAYVNFLSQVFVPISSDMVYSHSMVRGYVPPAKRIIY